jgi:4-oxalocrotonate tautomerase|tara:strand:+ start:1274 stop:1498 length:225 start_codon:yes stop_codon:yes gene_type:complete
MQKKRFEQQGEKTMPMIRAEFLTGKTQEQKRELVEALTRETARVLGVREQSVWVVLQEVEPENWAVAGTPLSER